VCLLLNIAFAVQWEIESRALSLCLPCSSVLKTFPPQLHHTASDTNLEVGWDMGQG